MDDKFIKYDSTTPLFVIIPLCMSNNWQFSLIGEFHDKSL